MPVSKVRNRVCRHCGTEYTLGVESTQHKYCSIKCRNAYHNAHGGKRYRDSEKGKVTSRRWRLKTDFNLSLEEFDERLKSQDYSCKICSRTNFTGYNWHVDHCHDTNQVRGILCSKCNQALGLFDDSINSLERAKEYLENFTARS